VIEKDRRGSRLRDLSRPSHRRGEQYRATASASGTRWTLTWRSGWTRIGGTRCT